jgi:hypothetical protein
MADLSDPALPTHAHRSPHSPVEEPPEPDEQSGPIDPDDGESDEPTESPERRHPPGKLGRVVFASELGGRRDLPL